MVLHSSAHMNQAEMVWPRADGMAEIAHNVNRRYRYIKEAGIPYRIRTTVFQFILLITRFSALSSAQHYLTSYLTSHAIGALISHGLDRASNHDLDRASNHDLDRASNHDLDRASNHDLDRASNHDLDRASNHDLDRGCHSSFIHLIA